MWRSRNGERILLGVVIIHVYVAPEAEKKKKKSAKGEHQILEKIENLSYETNLHKRHLPTFI